MFPDELKNQIVKQADHCLVAQNWRPHIINHPVNQFDPNVIRHVQIIRNRVIALLFGRGAIFGQGFTDHSVRCAVGSRISTVFPGRGGRPAGACFGDRTKCFLQSLQRLISRCPCDASKYFLDRTQRQSGNLSDFRVAETQFCFYFVHFLDCHNNHGVETPTGLPMGGPPLPCLSEIVSALSVWNKNSTPVKKYQ